MALPAGQAEQETRLAGSEVEGAAPQSPAGWTAIRASADPPSPGAVRRERAGPGRRVMDNAGSPARTATTPRTTLHPASAGRTDSTARKVRSLAPSTWLAAADICRQMRMPGRRAEPAEAVAVAAAEAATRACAGSSAVTQAAVEAVVVAPAAAAARREPAGVAAEEASRSSACLPRSPWMVPSCPPGGEETVEKAATAEQEGSRVPMGLVARPGVRRLAMAHPASPAAPEEREAAAPAERAVRRSAWLSTARSRRGRRRRASERAAARVEPAARTARPGPP